MDNNNIANVFGLSFAHFPTIAVYNNDFHWNKNIQELILFIFMNLH